jgi:Tol biopolymer transport system component
MKKFAPFILIIILTGCSILSGSSNLISQAGSTQQGQLPGKEPNGKSSTWVSLGLSGHLVLIPYDPEGLILTEMDLTNGNTRTLYKPPQDAWLAGAAISPDSKQIALAYSPPTTGNQVQMGYTDLYLMPYDGTSSPQPLQQRKTQEESFFNPTWAPDGKTIYYSHFFLSEPKGPTYKYEIERLTPGGKPEVILENALWPRLSADGTKMSYLSADPLTGANDLYFAGSNGSKPIPLLQHDAFPAVDAHLFYPDGDTVLFSAVDPPKTRSSGWLERIFGIGTVSAHNIPSDWFTVSVTTRQMQRLTNLYDTGMYPVLSPDGKRIAFISSNGLFVMDTDGKNLLTLNHITYFGTLEWVR